MRARRQRRAVTGTPHHVVLCATGCNYVHGHRMCQAAPTPLLHIVAAWIHTVAGACRPHQLHGAAADAGRRAIVSMTTANIAIVAIDAGRRAHSVATVYTLPNLAAAPNNLTYPKLQP